MEQLPLVLPQAFRLVLLPLDVLLRRVDLQPNRAVAPGAAPSGVR